MAIATLYGLGGDEMSLGNRICMSCHGTAKSASPAVAVRDGVSCESCHGGSEAYLEPHETGADPFTLGMTRLKDADARAANCSRCHLVTDERLLAAGHASGDGYDFVEANHSIEHFPDRRVWRGRDGDYPAVGDQALASAYQGIRGGRPVPPVSVVSVPRPSALPPAARAPVTQPPPPVTTFGATTGVPPTQVEPAARTVGAEEVRSSGEPSWNSKPPEPPAQLPRPTTRQSGPIAVDGIEPMPDSTDEMTAEDLLLLVKRRLDRLYRILGGN